MSVLLKRRDATQATLDAWKGRQFAFGRADCAKLVTSHVRRMGHVVNLSGVGEYRSLLGAKKALKRFGHDNLIEAMDAHFPRIAPAAGMAGDVFALPQEDDAHPLGALVVGLGNGACLGWHPDEPGAVAMRMLAFVAAWRVAPQ